MPHIDGYADFLVEDVRVQLGYDAKDNSHDDEVLAKLTAGEKLSKSKHLAPRSKWGLYLNGELMAEYDIYADALEDLLFALKETGLKHELKIIK
ncbi:hypothetical protein [Bacillus phage vB_BanS-Thrax1]|nr:hypothetical protein [Bacillus phage vB_BanS-Thrax1]